MRERFVLLRFVFAGAASLAAIAASGAQSPSTTAKAELTPPAQCRKAATEWRVAQLAPALNAYRTATPATRADVQANYLAATAAAAKGMQKMAAECALKFPVATVRATHLVDLIELLNLAADTAGARAATDRLLTEKSLPERTRAQALLYELNRAVAEDKVFGILREAETLVTRIDQLPDSLVDIKVTAHSKMLGQYEYLDVAEGLEGHALAIIGMSRLTGTSTGLIGAYQSLARSFADRLRPDSALRIVETAERLFGATGARNFEDFRNRLALIGTRAAAIDSVVWINTDAKTVVTPAPGKVTLIEFTAHWCGPCKNSYPGLREVADRFKGKAFTGAMVTQLYGYIGARQNLKPAEEIEADKEYFGKEHAVPFPVAINHPVTHAALNGTLEPKSDIDYRVGGIPQIMIIDKKGIIRQIVIGWDHGNTARFTAYIEKLLAEP